MIKSQEWFKEKVKNYHGNKVEVLSLYCGSEKPVDIVYHCVLHGDTFTTLNAKNICKPYFLPCKQCQSIRKSSSAKGNDKKNKKYFYERLVDYCRERGGSVLESEWTRAKDTYHFKCHNPEHPVFKTTADALYSGEHWCPYCSGRRGDFQDELFSIVNKNNGELLSEYVDASTKLRVKCKRHNYVWDMLPGNIKKGRWCPVCNMGFNEKVVWDYFQNLHCNIKIQYTFEDLIGENNELLKFDFAIFDSKDELMYVVEIDDEEHRHGYIGNTPRQLQRKASIDRDKKKDNYCKTHNINLYRMEVPFNSHKKWDYEDYYRYVNTELKFIVNLSRKEV